MTAFTPASFSAFEVSIFLIFACACGERSTRPTSWPAREVGAVAGAARHLVDAVGAEGRVPTTVNLRPEWRGSNSSQAPFITLAASWTARTILS